MMTMVGWMVPVRGSDTDASGLEESGRSWQTKASSSRSAAAARVSALLARQRWRKASHMAERLASGGMGGAPSRVTLRMTAKSLESDEKGITPVSISSTVHPTDQMSAAKV